VCLETLLKVGSDAHITLGGNGKALEKIDIFHDSPPSPRLRTTPFALERYYISTIVGESWLATRSSGGFRAKGGGADGSRTHGL
jgi:hypothetical protein